MKLLRVFAVAVVFPAAAGVALRAADATPEADALRARLAMLERAVRDGDAAALRAAATRAGRVRLDLGGLDDAQGSYAPGQLEAVLSRVFQAVETRSFRLEADRRHAADVTAFARGVWVRRPRDGGAEIRETLTFVLRVEEGDWRIVEIRSSP